MRPTTEGRFRVFEDPHGEGWLFVRVDGWDPADAGRREDPGAGSGGDPDAGDAGATDEDDAGEAADAGGEGGPDPFEPIAVPRESHGDLDAAVGGLRPGYLVSATLEWTDECPRVLDIAVEKRTLFEFVDGASTVFQAAAQAWAEAGVEGEPMNSRVTRSTDGDPNGVLYVFAEQPGVRDLFEEFRSAARPLEPLIARVNEAHDSGSPGGGSGPDVPGLAPDGSIRVPTPGEDGDGSEVEAGDEDDDEFGPDREVFVVSPADEPFVIVYIVLRKGGVLADAMRDTYSRARPDEPLG